MCCGFKALEFWMLWLSITAAGFVSSTVFDAKTLVVDEYGTPLYEQSPDMATDADFEAFFFGYALALAFSLTVVLLLVLHCCPSKKKIASRGRKLYMLRLVQAIRLFVFVATIVLVQVNEKMEFKSGDELIVGWVLLGCEYVDVLIEGWILREKLHAASKPTVFAKTFVQLLASAMVAAQMVEIDQLTFLYAAVVLMLAYALYIARDSESEPSSSDPSDYRSGEAPRESLFERYEYLTAIVGFVFGLGLAVGFGGRHAFKEGSEVWTYGLLFAFNFTLPMLRKKYEHVTIDPAYANSYRRGTVQADQDHGPCMV